MKYDVILADPPWQDPHRWGRNTGTRTADSHYDTMTLRDICDMPVAQLADENCVLFMWITWPCVIWAREVMDAWGFDYRTLAWVWVKAKENGMGFHFGMGNYTRSNSEPCLLAVRGSMPVATHDISALIYSPVREHSRKPDEQYTKIDRLYPNTRRLELFARHQREGWDVFGNQVANSISLGAQP